MQTLLSFPVTIALPLTYLAIILFALFRYRAAPKPSRYLILGVTLLLSAQFGRFVLTFILVTTLTATEYAALSIALSVVNGLIQMAACLLFVIAVYIDRKPTLGLGPDELAFPTGAVRHREAISDGNPYQAPAR